MDFNLKQWRDESEEEDDQQTSKLPKLHLNLSPHQHSNSTLPFFLPQPTNPPSPYSCDNTNNTTNSTKFPRMGSNLFSMGQWQELEVQALIFRHMVSGSVVPPQLLQLVQNSLITSPPYYPLHHYYPHYHPPCLMQSGYWGKAAMDPEPGRCRRTDGKKWRCSRDVVAGQKYCERHMHRGKNRSRKPVEIPTPTVADGSSGGVDGLKTNRSAATRFNLSGPSVDLLHLNQSDVCRPLSSIDETKCSFEAPNDGKSGGSQTLRHFFDDWPKSLHEMDSASSSVASATNLSISMPGNSLSEFSLKLGTGEGDERGSQASSGQGDRPQLSWGVTWDANRVPPMGGPLAEALRSSMTTSSPTSVLHFGILFFCFEFHFLALLSSIMQLPSLVHGAVFQSRVARNFLCANCMWSDAVTINDKRGWCYVCV